MIIWLSGRRHRSDVWATRGKRSPLTGELRRGMLEVMHKTPFIVLLPLLILGGTVIAADQSKTRPAVKPPSACALVTKVEIEEVIGTVVGNGTPMNDRKMDICTFRNTKGDEVEILVTRSLAKRDLSKALEEARKAIPTATVREVPGLGDKALLVDQPSGGTLLSVYRAGDTLVVSVLEAKRPGAVSEAGHHAKADATAEKIARKAFKRF